MPAFSRTGKQVREKSSRASTSVTDVSPFAINFGPHKSAQFSIFRQHNLSSNRMCFLYDFPWSRFNILRRLISGSNVSDLLLTISFKSTSMYKHLRPEKVDSSARPCQFPKVTTLTKFMSTQIDTNPYSTPLTKAAVDCLKEKIKNLFNFCPPHRLRQVVYNDGDE